MRKRPLIVLSTIAAATLLLAGCSGGGDDPTATPTDGAGADLCSAAAASGAASDSVSVEGAVGEVSTATFDLDQKVDEIQRTVVTEGDGEEIAAGEYVRYALSAFDATTGERIGDAGYAPDDMLPSPVTADTALGQILGCATVGTRLSVAFPGTDTANAAFYVVDVLGVTPLAAWGEEQEPVEGMPEVTLADDGQPDVTMPDGDAPTDLKISVLKQGDGPAVAAGDTTLLQYYGVDWETGDSFDSSWKNGAPISIDGNTYVEGFIEALEGQKVGSQVLVVIPPALGYGEAGSSEHELAGKTLVFVIDILANQKAVAQQ
ncbi:FKBP-type peptidyl-prolyl cis-trans isomerase [Microbacterium sp. NPDC089695]|uniref:FKBP-type peptidyl-prolyl cis-trans isomerase n=1 Tax=Microbacterium sp. NPDC089695 TaxID=3364198 RepID=UPI0037FCC739